MNMHRAHPYERENTAAVFEAAQRLMRSGLPGDAFRVEIDAKGRFHIKPCRHDWRDEEEREAA